MNKYDVVYSDGFSEKVRELSGIGLFASVTDGELIFTIGFALVAAFSRGHWIRFCKVPLEVK